MECNVECPSWPNKDICEPRIPTHSHRSAFPEVNIRQRFPGPRANANRPSERGRRSARAHELRAITIGRTTLGRAALAAQAHIRVHGTDGRRRCAYRQVSSAPGLRR